MYNNFNLDCNNFLSLEIINNQAKYTAYIKEDNLTATANPPILSDEVTDEHDFGISSMFQQNS